VQLALRVAWPALETGNGKKWKNRLYLNCKNRAAQSKFTQLPSVLFLFFFFVGAQGFKVFSDGWHVDFSQLSVVKPRNPSCIYGSFSHSESCKKRFAQTADCSSHWN